MSKERYDGERKDLRISRASRMIAGGKGRVFGDVNVGEDEKA